MEYLRIDYAHNFHVGSHLLDCVAVLSQILYLKHRRTTDGCERRLVIDPTGQLGLVLLVTGRFDGIEWVAPTSAHSVYGIRGIWGRNLGTGTREKMQIRNLNGIGAHKFIV